MGKKIEKPAAAKLPAPIKEVAAKKPAAKPAVGKPAAAKPAAKPTPAAKKAAAPTFDEIQRQAYFVAERRLANGLPGDSESDWIQAEKELLAAGK